MTCFRPHLACHLVEQFYENECGARVEASITYNLKDFAPDLAKYEVVHIFLCKKIEIRRIAKNW
jgi:hypothetical protein